jgi:hypothetical protein
MISRATQYCRGARWRLGGVAAWLLAAVLGGARAARSEPASGGERAPEALRAETGSRLDTQTTRQRRVRVTLALEDGGDGAVVLPPRAEEPLGTWSFELPVPLIRQVGDKSNCGPTAAAMAVAAYAGEASPDGLRDLRNAIGEWTWQRFPRRQRRQVGSDAGGSTRSMMRGSLEHFGDERWLEARHPWLPPELWSLAVLKRSLAERRPMIVLAEAARLWNIRAPGLHWVVVVGLDRGRVLIHDPADGQRTAVPLGAFWTAWRLPAELRPPSPGWVSRGFEALVANRSLAVELPVTPEDRMAGLSGPHPW